MRTHTYFPTAVGTNIDYMIGLEQIWFVFLQHYLLITKKCQEPLKSGTATLQRFSFYPSVLKQRLEGNWQATQATDTDIWPPGQLGRIHVESEMR
jgi:hypothetical protein